MITTAADEFQPSLADIGQPLAATTFVTLDLETTGGSPADCGITEIGAVKTRGGDVIGEFHTLVDPGHPIPPLIVALTGITDAMVTTAPRIEAVLPSLIEFLGDAVLVAHNAPFDVGFLKAAFRAHHYVWPGNEIVDTVTLARRVTTKEEAPNKKLATLARVFGSPVSPSHRALDDARATVHILHGMLERLAHFGITHRDDLASLRNPMPERLRKKAPMADAVPAKPGVYTFRGPRGEALYVGTSKNMRARVKSYFTSAEQRRAMRDMVDLAVAVDTVVCATPLEAAVLEVRLIDQYRPRFNRRSVRPERTVWLRLTDEPFPRLAITRAAGRDRAVLGPMRSAADARDAIEVIQQTLGVRTCTTRLPASPAPGARACIQHDIGACSAPCIAATPAEYEAVTLRARNVIARDPSSVIEKATTHVAALAHDLNYERAARVRDGAGAIVDGAFRGQRLAAIRRCRIIAVRGRAGAWELASIVNGGLAGSASVSTGVWAAADQLAATWDGLNMPEPLVEEQEIVAAWLEAPTARLLFVDGEWAHPITGAGPYLHWVEARNRDRAQRASAL